jgi:AcrR family transcriptional regulator
MERGRQAMGGSPSLSQSGAPALMGEPAGTDEPGGGRKSTPPATPLYKRLPHGPHRIPRDEVNQNQRARIHGGMVEAVAQYGYTKTSVKVIVALAGVSRRSFYEHYANKEECFLTSVDLIAARIAKLTNEAYRGVDGALEDRLRAGIEQFTEEAGGSSNSASLVIVQAPMAGAAGMLHLCRATGAFEQMLLSSFAHAPEVSDLPLPIIRGIIGGLHEVISVRLRTGRAEEIPALTEELLQWTLLFGTAPEDPMAARLADRALASLRSTIGHATNGNSTNGHTTNGHSANGHTTNGHTTNGHSANGHTTNGHSTNGHSTNGNSTNGHTANGNSANGHPGASASPSDTRGRLLECALRLAVVENHKDLSPLQIADEAGVSMDSFFELFDHLQECLTAAVDAMSDKLLQITADPDLVGQDWPRAVRKAIGALMHHLATHPLHAQIIATGAYAGGLEMIERNYELARDIAMLLTEGAPEEVVNEKFAVDAVAGAIWHTVRCQVAGEQVQRLPALSDYLAYVVLAPFIGTERAAGIVTEEQPKLEPALG